MGDGGALVALPNLIGPLDCYRHFLQSPFAKHAAGSLPDRYLILVVINQDREKPWPGIPGYYHSTMHSIKSQLSNCPNPLKSSFIKMNKINGNANSRSFNAFASKLLLKSVIHFHLSKQLFAPTYLVIDRPFVFVCVCRMSN